MKKWKLKAIVQKVISFLPFKNKINYFFQKYVTKGVYLNDEYFYDRLGHAQAHLVAFQKYSAKQVPDTALELGTGWYPVVPIAFFLCGSEVIYSVDLSFLTSKDRLKTTIGKFLEAEKKGDLKKYISIKEERWKAFISLSKEYDKLGLETILKKLQLVYLVEDARKLTLADNTIELVNSNNTFEHIYPVILKPILKEFDRVVNKQNGVMSHFIDMSDHFAHFDKTISIYHFLQFSEKKWKRIDNSIQPQNRLRIDDYKNLYSQLNISITEESFRPGNSLQLRELDLASPFKEKPENINAISHCHFITVYKN